MGGHGIAWLRRPFAAVAGLSVALVAGLLAGPGAARGGDRPRVALLLPEAKTSRYETKDRGYFEAELARLCPHCRLLYANAGQNTARQLSQVEAALANDADIVVLDPVDARAARAAVIRAEEAGVPVVAYDRLIDDHRVDWYVSSDNEAVGRLQGAALARLVAGRPGRVAMFHGSRSDPNAAEYRRGAMAELSGRGVRILGEWWIDDWDPDAARRRLEQVLSRYGADALSGVYVANDTMAEAVIESLSAAGIRTLPPVTGQDAELPAVRRVLDGQQSMTVYKPLRLQARKAAQAAVSLASGHRPRGAAGHHGTNGVPGILLTPVLVDAAGGGLERLVADGFWAASLVCAGREVQCRDAGLPAPDGRSGDGTAR